MKWVLINHKHINMNNVDEFYWEDGVLCIFFNSDLAPYEYADPDRELYLRMCRSQGIRPFGED